MTFCKKLFLLLALIPLSVFSQKTTITGTAPGAQGKTIRLVKYSDLMTYSDTCIATSTIDSKGSFSISVPLKETIFSYLKIDFNRAPIYLVPGKNYQVKIDSIDYDAPDDKTNPYLNPPELKCTILSNDSNELNNAITKFNSEYDTFVAQHFISISRSRDKKKLDTFKLKIQNSYKNINDVYFTNIVKYRFAALEYTTRTIGDKTVLKKYFSGPPVLYENTAYMEFFNQFFDGYITAESKKIKFKDLDTTINKLVSYTALLDSLGKDTTLKNEVIRELALLKALGELYDNPLFNKSAVLKIISDLATQTKFAAHKNIAENYLKTYTRLAKDAFAPEFILSNFSNESYTLSEFKGRYVYLIFWSTWCIPCISEIALLEKMKATYGTKVEFVAVSCDKQFNTAYYYLQNKKSTITNLFWGNQASLLESYNVKTFPTYVLIGPDGKIVDYPTIKPSVNLDAYLSFLTGIKSK